MSIAGVVLSIRSQGRAWRFPSKSTYGRFLTVDGGQAVDASIRAHWGPALLDDFGEQIFSAQTPEDTAPVLRLYRRGSQRIAWVRMSTSDIRTNRIGIFDRDFRSGDVYVELLAEPQDRYPYPLSFPLDRVLLLNLLGLGRGLMMHASGIAHQGRGLLFTGPSGAGKSTLARLWSDHPGTTVLGDECLIVRRVGGQYRVYGTPWTGPDSVASPGGVPLQAIFFIDHASDNAASPRQEVSAVEGLLARAFSTFYDREAMQYTLDFCAHLGQSVPAYDLGFTPTPDIVRFVQDMDPS